MNETAVYGTNVTVSIFTFETVIGIHMKIKYCKRYPTLFTRYNRCAYYIS